MTSLVRPHEGPSAATDAAVPARGRHARRPGPRHVAALDGLRAVAVGAVLLFHHGVGWAQGGFLGVSLFFTLSGFLIAALLAGEARREGRVDGRAFWVRRARRLLPAALATVAATWVLAAFVPLGEGGDALRDDAVASVLYAANWQQAFAGGSYGELFTSPSPFLHLWSLAVEEQAYLVLGVLAVALAGRGRRFATALAGLAVVGVGWSVLSVGRDAAYYDTLVRAPEILVGALGGLAVGGAVLARRRLPDPVHLAVPVAGPLLVLTWVVLVATTDVATYTTRPWLLPLVGVLNLGVVVAAGTPGGGLGRALSHPTLVAVGRLSYAVYLVHWPLFLWLDADRIGFGGPALLVVRLAATLLAAVVLRAAVELPAMRSLRRPRSTVVALGAATLAVLVLVAAVTPRADGTAVDFEALATELGAGGGATTAAAPAEAPRTLVFGDSTSLVTGIALDLWSRDDGSMAVVGGSSYLGCGLVRDGERRNRGAVFEIDPECDWAPRVAATLDRHPEADAAVILYGPFDVTDHRLPGDDEWRALGDPVFDAHLLAEMEALTAVLLARDLEVVWLSSPVIDNSRLQEPPPTRPHPESDPARMARFNELVRGVVDAQDGVHLVDFAGILARSPGGELDPAVRPDGVHLTDETALEVAEDLGPAVVAALGETG